MTDFPAPVTHFATSDGKTWETYADAVRHEAKLKVSEAASNIIRDWDNLDILVDALLSPSHPLSVAVAEAHLTIASLEYQPDDAPQNPDASFDIATLFHTPQD